MREEDAGEDAVQAPAGKISQQPGNSKTNLWTGCRQPEGDVSAICDNRRISLGARHCPSKGESQRVKMRGYAHRLLDRCARHLQWRVLAYAAHAGASAHVRAHSITRCQHGPPRHPSTCAWKLTGRGARVLRTCVRLCYHRQHLVQPARPPHLTMSHSLFQ